MQNFRTWNDLYAINGIVKTTGYKNPYSKESEEYYMVEYVCSLNNKELLYINTDQHASKIIDLYKDNNMEYLIDPWYIYSLFGKAVWVARAAGCIQLERIKKHNNKIFACYFETGMINYLNDENFMKELNKIKNPERKQAIHQVLKKGDYLFGKANLPIIKHDSFNKKIEISYHTNANKELLNSIESIPFQTLSIPTISDVSIDTRGCFHHLGDDTAFLFGATEYGEAYIVGNDEFGDLIVIGVLPSINGYKNNFKVGDRISSQDIDFLYGVPRANALYPSKLNNYFNYSSEDSGNCKLNTKENSVISSYWNTETFKRNAKREVNVFSFTQFCNYIKDKIDEVLNMSKYKKQLNAFNAMLELLNSEKINNLLNKNLLGDHSNNIFAINSIRLDILVYTYYNNYTTEANKQVIHTEVENLFEKISQQQKLDPIATENLKKYFKEYEEIITTIKNLQSLKDEDFNTDIYKNLSFFYKATAHKVVCQIVNPDNSIPLGFFKKDGVHTKPLDGKIILDSFNNHIDFPGFLRKTFSYTESLKESLIKDLYKRSGLDDSYDKLLKYWAKLDNKSFIVSNVVDMQNEYRIFVVNGRPVAGSPCFRNSTPFDAYNNGRFDARLCDGHSAYETYEDESTRKRVSLYAKFARNFCKEMKEELPQSGSYVLDVAWSNMLQEVLAIEINTVSWSGAYQIDMRRVCAAVAKKPFYYQDMTGYGNYNWIDQNIALVEEQKVLTEEAQRQLKESKNKVDMTIDKNTDMEVFLKRFEDEDEYINDEDEDDDLDLVTTNN